MKLPSNITLEGSSTRSCKLGDAEKRRERNASQEVKSPARLTVTWIRRTNRICIFRIFFNVCWNFHGFSFSFSNLESNLTRAAMLICKSDNEHDYDKSIVTQRTKHVPPNLQRRRSTSIILKQKLNLFSTTDSRILLFLG